MTALEISLLGPLKVSKGGKNINKFESNKVRALLAYLVLETERTHSRETVAEMLWPESTPQSGLANLRYALADMRKVIGDEEAKPPYLIINRESLQFNAFSDHALDVTAFTRLIRSNKIEKLTQGIDLYLGDFLEGFPFIESDPFEEWIVLKREQFKRQAIDALSLIVDHHEHRGEYQQALPFARKQVELEPWLEEAHQQLIRLLARDGQRSAALAQYETCRRLLASELDVEPAEKTIQLYESIRDGTLEKTPALLKRDPPAPGDAPFKGLHHFDEKDAGLFFGREALVSHLVQQIQAREKPKNTRFLAVIGASGSGKSSLVRAGLIPALRRSNRALRAHVITPTEHPLEALSAYRKIDDVSKGNILLFADQFEELFTLCQNEGERKSFIDELLGIAHGSIVVIALRADFYAACAPYEELRKTLSQNQEYIGPMNAAELRRAIEEPARVSGWLLEPGLTDLLLRDIGADGEHAPEPGALPLLSHALLETWRRRSGRLLTLAGYAESGRIHKAITKTAESVFAQLTPDEQSIARNIFLRLTGLGEGAQETRRRVSLTELLPSPAPASPLNKTTEAVLKMLSDARLVITTEITAEIAHEAVIREWNRLHEWLAENREGIRLHRHITESAKEWEHQGCDKELAYRGGRLIQALEWAGSHSGDMNSLERDFLESSKALAEKESAERKAQQKHELEAAQKLAESERQRAEGQMRTARQLRQRAVYLAGILLLALIMAVTAFVQRDNANKQAHLATARELALASINNLNSDAEFSILLALQAIKESNTANVPVPYEVQDALHRAIQSSRIHYTVGNHAEDVLAVAFSPDGKLLASAGSDGIVVLREAKTGKELMTLHGHTEAIEDAAFSHDGKYLATVSDDKTAKIWDVSTRQEVHTLIGHTDIVWNVSFSDDGKLLATAGFESMKVWDTSTGQLKLTLDGQSAPAVFSPVGKQLASSSSDGTTKIWDVETGKELLSLPYYANALAFSPDGKLLATAMSELKVWDLETGTELFTSTGFAAIIGGIGFSPDGNQLATGSQDGTVTVWDAQTGRRLFGLAGHAGAINDVSFSPKCDNPDSPFEWCETWLASASRDGTAKLWDVSPGGSRELITLPGFSGSFLENTRLFTNSLDLFNTPNEIKVRTWNISPEGNSTLISSFFTGHVAPIILGGTSPNGLYQVTMHRDNTVKAWDTQTGKEMGSFVANQILGIAGIAISPTGTHVAMIDNNGTVIIRDIASGQEILKSTGYVNEIIGVSFSPDGTRVAIGSHDGTVKILEIGTGLELFTLTGHKLPVYVISFSPDGKRIATGGMDQTVIIWDAETEKNLFTLTGHTASILAITFNPDGSLLATGSHDATTRIWDTANGDELLTLTGHDGYVDTVSFSPNGKLLTTGSFQDGTMRVYMLDIVELTALARSRLTRSFTIEECQKYLHQETCP